MENQEQLSKLFAALKSKGNPILLSGPTGGGKSTLISRMARNGDVEALLSNRESQGKGSTVDTNIVVTDDPNVPEDCLLVGGRLCPMTQADCDDDLTLLSNILFYATKTYGRAKLNADTYAGKIKEELDKRLKSAETNPENDSLVYRLRDISGEEYDQLLGAMQRFQPEKLFPHFQEAEALNPKDTAKQMEAFKDLLRKDEDLKTDIQNFWDVVIICLNVSLDRLEQLLRDENAAVSELEEGGKSFFVALNEASIGGPLATALLKSENGAKEYLLKECTLVFRGFSELFPERNKEYLTVLEREGTSVHCWRFIDTQGLFHAQRSTTDTESSRIRDLLAAYHSNRLVLVLDSRINNTAKDSDMAISQMLSDIKSQIEVYFVYTRWDDYLKEFPLKSGSASSVRRGERKKIDWGLMLEGAQKSQDQRHKRFEESLALNQNKKKPAICGKVRSALLCDGESLAESCLEGGHITDREALPALLDQILKRQIQFRAKFRVTEGLETHFTLNTEGLGTVSIRELHRNLADCKNRRLYASTVRACVRKWVQAGTVHQARVNPNAFNFVTIETKFVEEIRNYAQGFTNNLTFDFSHCLCDPSEEEALKAKLLEVLKNNLGREVAKTIGIDAYHSGYDQPVPGKLFPYQYERLNHMFEYTQKNYFNAESIPLTANFQKIFQICVGECIKWFVDESCILVC